jgi:type IV pilus assembly protein PilP
MTAAARLGALVAVLLAGCGQAKLDELEGYVARVKARPPGPLEPIPEVPKVDTFIYEPGNRRDPFVMDDRTAQATLPQQGTGIAPDPLRRREELEQYSLDSLRMVGTLEQHNTRWGLVQTPDGVLHRVRVGNYLGQNNGQITQISEEAIALTEIIGEGSGIWRERAATISLRSQ